MAELLSKLDEFVAALIVALIVRTIGVIGLEFVDSEAQLINFTHAPRLYLLIAAPFFLGIMSYFLIRWSHGYKGPGELLAVLRQKTSMFPGWVKAIVTWLIACVELGSGLSPKGFEGPYLAAAGGLSGFLGTRLHLNEAARKRLARCGLGVAFGLLFRAPIAGFVCMFEFGGFKRREARELLVPAIAATAMNMWLTQVTKLPHPFLTWSIPLTISSHELVALCVLGIATGLTAVVYVLAIRIAKRGFHLFEGRLHPVLIPILGAAGATLLAASFPIITGSNEVARVVTAPGLATAMLAGAIAAKLLATALADGSKLAGGTVGPAILLGALVGRFVGGTNPLFAVAGAAACIGPVAGLPITMLVTALTWLNFSPAAIIVAIPLGISWIISSGLELYPYASGSERPVSLLAGLMSLRALKRPE